MTSRPQLALSVMVLGGALNAVLGCAAFETRSLCDSGLDCDVFTEVCTEGFCVAVSDGDPEPSQPEPVTPEPVPEPSPTPTPEPDGCPTQGCQCMPIELQGSLFNCGDAVNFETAQLSCESVGESGFYFTPENLPQVMDALDQFGGSPPFWTGFSVVNSQLRHRGDAVSFSLEDFRDSWSGDFIPTIDGCLQLDHDGLSIVNCTLLRPFLCGTFESEVTACGDTQSSPSNCGGCDIVCPAFECANGYCAPNVRATLQAGQLSRIYATQDAYWVVDDTTEPSRLYVFRPPQDASPDLVLTHEVEFPNAIDVAIYGPSIFLLYATEAPPFDLVVEEMRISGDQIGRTVLTTFESVPTIPASVLHVDATRWLVARGGQVVYGPRSGDPIFTATLPTNSAISTLTSVGNRVMVTDHDSVNINVLSVVDNEFIGEGMGAFGWQAIDVFHERGRVTYAVRSEEMVRFVWADVDSATAEATWSVAETSLPLPVSDFRGFVVVGDEIYVNVRNEMILSIAAEQSRSTQTVAVGNIESLVTVAELLVWIRQNQTLVELIPPQYPSP